MTDENREEAAEAAKRAGRQAKNAGKNVAKSAKLAAEPVVEEAQDTLDKFEGTADDAMDAARRFNGRALGRLSSDTGQGFLALSVAIWAGTLAVSKFKGVYASRTQVLSND